MSRPILAAIDNAIEDWELGPDVMRWSAEPPPSSADPDSRVSIFRHSPAGDLVDWCISWTDDAGNLIQIGPNTAEVNQ